MSLPRGGDMVFPLMLCMPALVMALSAKCRRFPSFAPRFPMAPRAVAFFFFFFLAAADRQVGQ